LVDQAELHRMAHSEDVSERIEAVNLVLSDSLY
jgi:hypothetical protein